MWEIIIGIIGIGLIILGYFISDIKKYIKERERRKKGLCIGCGVGYWYADKSMTRMGSPHLYKCGVCGRVQPSQTKKGVKKKGE